MAGKKGKKKNSKTARTLLGRFSEGDDTILNADSSPERRLVEAVALVMVGDSIYKALSPVGAAKIAPEFDLKATTGLPLSVGGIGDSAGVQVGLLAAERLAASPVGQATQAIAGPLLGKKTENKLNPAQTEEAGQVQINVTGNVLVRDFLIAALVSGYLIEKAAPAIKASTALITGAKEGLLEDVDTVIPG